MAILDIFSMKNRPEYFCPNSSLPEMNLYLLRVSKLIFAKLLNQNKKTGGKSPLPPFQ